MAAGRRARGAAARYTTAARPRRHDAEGEGEEGAWQELAVNARDAPRRRRRFLAARSARAVPGVLSQPVWPSQPEGTHDTCVERCRVLLDRAGGPHHRTTAPTTCAARAAARSQPGCEWWVACGVARRSPTRNKQVHHGGGARQRGARHRWRRGAMHESGGSIYIFVFGVGDGAGRGGLDLCCGRVCRERSVATGEIGERRLLWARWLILRSERTHPKHSNFFISAPWWI